MNRWLGSILSLASCTAFAADLSVTVIPSATAGDCLTKGELTASPENGSNRIAVPLERGVFSYVLHPPRSASWTVRVASPGCWSESAVWSGGDSAALDLHVFKAAAVEIAIDVPKQAKSPSSVIGKVYFQRGESAAKGLDTTCTSMNGKWRCAVPAGLPFDFRLDAAGYASAYFWELSPAPDAVAGLGSITLTPGASIAGWVHDPKDKPVRNSVVSCFPMELAAGKREHAAARIESVRTNSRGFFQCAGLREGQYRLVVDGAGLSPMAISDILVRTGESLVLPKAVRPPPLGEAELTFDPPLDHRGKPWSVEMTEATTLHPSRERKSVAHSASASGRWTAGGLRADLYAVEIRDSAGSLVERTTIDLFGGGHHTLMLNIRPIVVRGTVRAGDRPLKATLELSDTRGGFLKTSSDEDGHFETPLPGAGEWQVTVLYPPRSAAARIAAPAIHIPDPVPASPFEVTVQLPGGRIYGTVVGEKGERGQAAVHARRERTAAQQLTEDDGAFDLVGLAPGTYQLDAQNDAGMTPTPVEVHIDKDESRQVTLVTEPNVLLSGVVVTPDGRPASGAVVRISSNTEPRWATRVADIRGRFEYTASRATRVAQVVVVTYDYPVAFKTVSIREDEPNEQRIQLRNDGGVVRVRGAGEIYISTAGVVAPFGILTYSRFVRRADGGAYVESGVYTVCQGRGPDACRTVTVTPGSEHDLDLTPKRGGDETHSRGT